MRRKIFNVRENVTFVLFSRFIPALHLIVLEEKKKRKIKETRRPIKAKNFYSPALNLLSQRRTWEQWNWYIERFLTPTQPLGSPLAHPFVFRFFLPPPKPAINYSYVEFSLFFLSNGRKLSTNEHIVMFKCYVNHSSGRENTFCLFFAFWWEASSAKKKLFPTSPRLFLLPPFPQQLKDVLLCLARNNGSFMYFASFFSAPPSELFTLLTTNKERQERREIN